MIYSEQQTTGEVLGNLVDEGANHFDAFTALILIATSFVSIVGTIVFFAWKKPLQKQVENEKAAEELKSLPGAIATLNRELSAHQNEIKEQYSTVLNRLSDYQQLITEIQSLIQDLLTDQKALRQEFERELAVIKSELAKYEKGTEISKEEIGVLTQSILTLYLQLRRNLSNFTYRQSDVEKLSRILGYTYGGLEVDQMPPANP